MENKKTKIIIIIAAIIILILLVVVLTVKLVNIKNSKEDTPTINTNSMIENDINNIANENIQNNNIDETEKNNINENNINNNSYNSNQQTSMEEIDNESIQIQEDKKEKAIKIVKENWGEDEKVYFSFDSIDNNGKYIVSVRNRISTEAICWYTVDVETGNFSIE